MSLVDIQTMRVLTPCVLTLAGIVPVPSTAAAVEGFQPTVVRQYDESWGATGSTATLSAELDQRWMTLRSDLARAVRAVRDVDSGDYYTDDFVLGESQYLKVMEVPIEFTEEAAQAETVWDAADEAAVGLMAEYRE